MKLLLILLCLSLVLAVSQAGLRIRVRITFKKKRDLEQQMQKEFPELTDDLLGEAEERRDASQLTDQQKLKLGTGIGKSIEEYFEQHQDLLENKDS